MFAPNVAAPAELSAGRTKRALPATEMGDARRSPPREARAAGTGGLVVEERHPEVVAHEVQGQRVVAVGPLEDTINVGHEAPGGHDRDAQMAAAAPCRSARRGRGACRRRRTGYFPGKRASRSLHITNPSRRGSPRRRAAGRRRRTLIRLPLGRASASSFSSTRAASGAPSRRNSPLRSS